ncbi:MAG: response regulator transcription factor [Campylobacterota bacterium]|nr:response regulator transcription factor [Campylobacterota bacterium]
MINSKELLNYTKELSILFVEDQDDLRISTTEVLKNFFKIVENAEDGNDAINKYNSYARENSGKYYDIVLTDLAMPKVNGLELTQSVYKINPKQSLIVLSAHDESKFLLPLINLGIEQFIKKPLDFQELLQALLNTSKKIINSADSNAADNNLEVIPLGEFCVYNKLNSSLKNNQENIYLTKYEIIFLQQLTTDIGKIYSNEDIVSNYLVENENIDAQNIRKLVSKLRKKLPKDSLESIYGVGYRFIPYYK